MPHPDHETYRDKRLRITTPGQASRLLTRGTRRRQEQVETPGDRVDFPIGIDLPPGFSKGDGAQTFTPVSSTGYARYIGRAVPRLQAVNFLYRVTTLAATVTYAEFGLCISETPQIATGLADNTLTLVDPEAWLDVSGVITATGRKLGTIDQFNPVNHGAHLWLLFVVQATTPGAYRGGVPQECGLLISKAGAARPSTMGANAAFIEVATSMNDLWLPTQQIQA